MSSHTFSKKIDQKEYLKKYLSGDKHKKKKKKEKEKEKEKRSGGKEKVRIIDDDEAHASDNGQYIDEELLLTGEDAPQIVGEYVEERPDGDAKKSKWRSITVKEENVDEENGERREIKKEPEDRWGKRACDIKLEKDFSPDRRRHANKMRKHSADVSPVRRPRRQSFNSPQRGMRQKEKQRDNGNDMSPPRRRNDKHSSVSPQRRGKNSFDDKARHQVVKREPRSPSRDMSPPRKGRRFSTSPKPRRRSRDQSPVRRRNSPRKPRQTSEDQSAPRRNDHRFMNRPNVSPKPRRRSSRDLSPPRQKKPFSPPPQPRQRQPSDDQSPPRRKDRVSPKPRPQKTFSPRRQRQLSPDHNRSPPRRRSSRDLSPPRYKKPFSPPPPRQRQFSADHSPPRRNQKNLNGFEQQHRRPKSPPMRGRYSPPRSPRSNSDPRNPFRKSSRENSRSSPRREARNHRDDFSHGRRRDSADSPPRPRRPANSPPRNGERAPYRRNSLTSPARRPDSFRRRSNSPRPPFKSERKANSPGRFRGQRPDKSLSPPPTHKPRQVKTIENKKAGLQDAKSLRLENEERRRQEDLMFAGMSKEESGRDAEVNVRSTGRKGRRARMAEEEDPEVKRRKEEREKQKKDLYDRWGKGLKQIEDHRARRAEQEHESNKPLARYKDDEDLERHLREREHPDDPMLAYMRQKRKEKEVAENKPVIPIYEGPYPENRFGIRPGYRWDGVDRSNGYEQKWFNVQNERRAMRDDAYKYSIEDM